MIYYPLEFVIQAHSVAERSRPNMDSEQYHVNSEQSGVFLLGSPDASRTPAKVSAGAADCYAAA